MSRNEFACDCNIIHKDMVNAALSKMPDVNTFNKYHFPLLYLLLYSTQPTN